MKGSNGKRFFVKLNRVARKNFPNERRQKKIITCRFDFSSGNSSSIETSLMMIFRIINRPCAKSFSACHLPEEISAILLGNSNFCRRKGESFSRISRGANAGGGSAGAVSTRRRQQIIFQPIFGKTFRQSNKLFRIGGFNQK